MFRGGAPDSTVASVASIGPRSLVWDASQSRWAQSWNAIVDGAKGQKCRQSKFWTKSSPMSPVVWNRAFSWARKSCFFGSLVLAIRFSLPLALVVAREPEPECQGNTNTLESVHGPSKDDEWEVIREHRGKQRQWLRHCISGNPKRTSWCLRVLYSVLYTTSTCIVLTGPWAQDNIKLTCDCDRVCVSRQHYSVVSALHSERCADTDTSNWASHNWALNKYIERYWVIECLSSIF